MDEKREILQGFTLLDLSCNGCDCFMRNCIYGIYIHKYKSHGRLFDP